MKLLTSMALICALCVTSPSFAEDRPDHFKGKPADTLEQALANFNEYNIKLAKIIAQKELSAGDMHEVHQLTYTLENALQKIQEEYAQLAEVLEDVHVASESANITTVKSQGKAYLDTSSRIAP